MIAQQRDVRSVSAAHCTDPLSAKENPGSCNVRRCQKNCDKLLHCLTIDRGAPWSLYPAIKRSVVCASPLLRYPSPNCDQAKARRSAQAADFVQTHCSRYADHGSVARASCSPNRPRQGCRSRGRRTGCSQIRRGTDLVMSGIVESGRESGHGDIDANDPEQTSRVGTCTMAFTSTH